MALPAIKEDGSGFAASYATPQDVAAMQSDPLSPTLIAQRFLQSQGLPLTSENMRRVLVQNAQQPGYIHGLVNNEPSNLPGTPVTGGTPTQQGANATGALPTPPIPPMSTVSNATSSNPTGADTGPSIATAIGTAILAGLPALAQWMRGAPTSAQSGAIVERPVPTFDAQRVPTNDTTITPAPRQLEAPPVRGQLPPPPANATIPAPTPQPQLPGPQGATALPPPATGVERAQMRGQTHPKFVPNWARMRIP